MKYLTITGGIYLLLKIVAVCGQKFTFLQKGETKNFQNNLILEQLHLTVKAVYTRER